MIGAMSRAAWQQPQRYARRPEASKLAYRCYSRIALQRFAIEDYSTGGYHQIGLVGVDQTPTWKS